MKTRFKIHAGLEKKREVDKIIIPPDVSPGDFPYYIEVENNYEDNLSFFKSVYVNSIEKNHKIEIDNAEIFIGKISGKVYEVKISEPLNNRIFTEIIKLIKNHLTHSNNKKDRYKNNVSFSIKILKEAYNGLKEKSSESTLIEE